MTAHLCKTITPGCYRCDLNLDEVADAIREEAEQAAREAACPGHQWSRRISEWGSWRVCDLCRAEDEG